MMLQSEAETKLYLRLGGEVLDVGGGGGHQSGPGPEAEPPSVSTSRTPFRYQLDISYHIES